MIIIYFATSLYGLICLQAQFYKTFLRPANKYMEHFNHFCHPLKLIIYDVICELILRFYKIFC